ncbi:MAG: hypothetical protein KF713_08880 [Turneriella sp.]|nr:hypothetical protein [Turneriella sp.]
MIQTIEISKTLENSLHNQVAERRLPGGNYTARTAWPGIQLYYPPIKYMPAQERYETEAEARLRLERYARASHAHTIIFDLEDGCRQKAGSRSFLSSVLPEVRQHIPGNVAIRINPMGTPENKLDLKLIAEIYPYIDDVMLAKAGEQEGLRDLSELANFLTGLSRNLRIQPIIEHPLALRKAADIFALPAVEHVVFGIHDFSRAMHVQITPGGWQQELYPFMCSLSLEARLAGKGLIGGVETLLIEREVPEIPLLPEWLVHHADTNAKTIFAHARREAAMGYTGKQVIHPNHIPLVRYGFQPEAENIRRSLRILEAAVKANAFLGGAIRFEDEMMDPPMFAKALQVILRSIMLGNKEKDLADVALGIVASLPAEKIREIWPYALNGANHVL